MHETVNRGNKNKHMKYESKLTYRLSFWNVSRKVDYHAGGMWFIHGPKRYLRYICIEYINMHVAPMTDTVWREIWRPQEKLTFTNPAICI